MVFCVFLLVTDDSLTCFMIIIYMRPGLGQLLILDLSCIIINYGSSICIMTCFMEL